MQRTRKIVAGLLAAGAIVNWFGLRPATGGAAGGAAGSGPGPATEVGS
jgi:hypothetical protein